MNLPNKLTVLRVILVPFFMVCAAFHWWLPAGIIFAAASFTDYLDGQIARKNNLVTDFGKFMDPLADKILTTTAFLYMLADGVCSPIVLTIILAQEFAVAGMRMIAAGAKNGKVIPANMWGKVKTVVQMLTIIVYYFGMAFLPAATIELVTIVLCWIVAAVTLISGVKYLYDGRDYIKNAK